MQHETIETIPTRQHSIKMLWILGWTANSSTRARVVSKQLEPRPVCQASPTLSKAAAAKAAAARAATEGAFARKGRRCCVSKRVKA